MSEKVPFNDLGAQIRSLETEIKRAIDETVSSHAFINGPAVERFSRGFLKLHGGNFGIGCSNGTSAITIALRALGIGAGDEVLVPNHTFFGTVEPLLEVGAVPVLVDIEPEFRQLDLKMAESKITSKTRAIIPVHLYGMPEPMDEIMSFAKKYNLSVVEDCAQAHLAKWKGQPVGTFGDVGTFSFFPGKNLGAFGDAGFILTGDKDRFEFIRRYIDHGRVEKYVHDFFGGNFRIDTIQAAVLEVKLSKLAEWTERRRTLAKAYDERFSAKGFRVLTPRNDAVAAYHLYVIEVSNRSEVQEHLSKNGIGSGIHYPITLNQQPAFKKLGLKKGAFPVSELMAEKILSLAFYPEMTIDQLDRVAEVFLQVAKP
jgi:dTDP-4-amino-4,6-dideoxygalactose transaminase